MSADSRIIGAEFRYVGTTHPWAKGLRVRVIAIHRGGDEGWVIDDDARLDGGLLPGDVVEFQPWVREEGRFSWVTGDAAPEDLAPM